MTSPYVSVVVAARNDDYGGDFLARFQMFLKVLEFSVEQAKLDAELIVVEWNPPREKPSLRDAVSWGSWSRTNARIIVVPRECHASLPNSDVINMFEYVAKNVGIRRSRGEFTLVTNPDVLITPALMKALATRPLVADHYYRTDRYDFRGRIPSDVHPKRLLRFARRNVQRVRIRHRRVEGIEEDNVLISSKTRMRGRVLGEWPGTHEGREASNDCFFPLCDKTEFYDGIYTNASGDFILAARSAWCEIRGFPEFTDTYIHLDSYACHQLHGLGLAQWAFKPPCMIFHAEHSRGDQTKRPALRDWKGELEALRSGKLGPALNKHDWGLGSENLTEHRPAPGS